MGTDATYTFHDQACSVDALYTVLVDTRILKIREFTKYGGYARKYANYEMLP